MDHILEGLKKAGLTGNEAKVYLELLQRKELFVAQLAKNTSLDRTLVYSLLNQLSDKGLVSSVIKQGKKLFVITAIENLLNSLKEQYVFVEDLIPKLHSIPSQHFDDQEVTVYEGKDGLKSIINLIRKEKFFCSFGATGNAFSELYEMPRIAKEIASKVSIKIIGSKELRDKEPFTNPNFEFRYLNTINKTTTSIFGDYVSIHQICEKPRIILIKNKDLAETYLSHFDVLWKSAKK